MIMLAKGITARFLLAAKRAAEQRDEQPIPYVFEPVKLVDVLGKNKMGKTITIAPCVPEGRADNIVMNCYRNNVVAWHAPSRAIDE